MTTTVGIKLTGRSYQTTLNDKPMTDMVLPRRKTASTLMPSHVEQEDLAVSRTLADSEVGRATLPICLNRFSEEHLAVLVEDLSEVPVAAGLDLPVETT